MRELLVSGKEEADLLPVLKTVEQWICWSFSHHPLKTDKVPIDPNDWDRSRGQFQAKSYHNSDIWMGYEAAHQRLNSEDQIDGIGFVLQNIEISFIDIDNCINDSSQVTNEVYQIIQDSESYAEISPSGNGIHILIRGNSPTYGSTSNPEGPDIEIYDGSWVTVTQRHIAGTPPEVRGNVGFTRRLCDRYNIRRPTDW